MRRTSLLLAVFLLPPGVAVRGAEAPAATLEGVLSSPLPSDLSVSPAGGAVSGRIAWVQNAEGVRNLWVADPPDYRGRAVTSFTGDDGQSVGSLAWTPDGKTLFFVRGDGGNRAGENPNPSSDPGGAEQDVWRIDLKAGAKAMKVALGTGPVVSPDGSGLAFRRGGKVLWLPLGAAKTARGAKAKAAEPVTLIQTRGASLALRFAPDGKRLAFVSARGDHSFVGIYDFAAKSVRWLAPSLDGDGEPVWSPDGKRLAFLRIAAASKVTLFHPNREATPWSILVADAASGEVRTVFTAEAGPGSVFQEIGEDVMPNQLLWGAGDRIVFPWEKDGWSHLYSVPAAGGTPVLLTPGEFEVESAALGADRNEVVYSSNQGHLERLHLWKVAVAGGAPVALTSGNGIETTGLPTADGKAIAFVHSGAREPMRAALLLIGSPGSEIRDLAPDAIPSRFPKSALVEPQAVVFSAADGLPIHGQLFLPPGGKPGERHPGVIFFHGGSHREMLLGFHQLGYYHRAYAFNQYLASRGFVVLAVNYRSGIGYGLGFREAEAQGASGGSELNDVLGAGIYLRGREDVDPKRIGLWGGSYGGYLTAMGLARASDLFAAGVDLHGVHDWNTGIQNFIPDYAPTPDEKRLAFESSPLATLDTWRSPVLLIHGDDDRNVNFNESVTLVQGLRERKVEVEQLILPDEVHSFLRHASWMAAYRAASEFLERKLGPVGSANAMGASPR